MLLCYDFMITFSNEVEFIWKRKFTLATVLFCVNRYATLFNQILLVVSLLPTSHTESEKVANLVGSLDIFITAHS